ncbi:MAG: NAD(P)-binding domain-containing protein, partial [Micrococcales bacterium]|nr:NAD(P)-binding domain-containing protein [Micrococcales bacterium]
MSTTVDEGLQDRLGAPRRTGYDVAIIGLGYVGLPLAQEAAAAGLRVLGYDVSARVVGALSDGRSHVDDLSDADIARMIDAGFEASL